MSQRYSNPAAYWQERLSRDFDLTGVGYGGLGPLFNQAMYRQRLLVLDALLRAHNISPTGANVAEVGCGTGFYTSWFARQQVASYVGVDITPVSVERLSAQFRSFRFAVSDVAAAPLPVSSPVDLLMIADVLFHIVDDDRFQAALQHMAAALRVGGWLILSDVLPRTTHQAAAHVRYRSLAVYQSMLDSCGMELLEIRPIFASLQPPPYVPSASWPWKLYARLWQYGLYRFGRLRLFDRLVPPLLAALDQRVLLSQVSERIPNSKWAVAVRRHGG
jgi:SAM-dependent methyltransferase